MATNPPVSHIAVLGAGTMGHGIAQVAAASGFATTLYDLDEAALGRARDRVVANLQAAVTKGKLTALQRDDALAQLAFSANLEVAVEQADLIIEAVPESLELKAQVFRNCSQVASSHCIYASNTSSLSLTALAAATDRPDRTVGMHFFNPPYVLTLLEIVLAEQTSVETLSVVRVVGDRMGRTQIEVRDSPGFATSRLGVVIALEAMRMLEQGVASAADIDTAMELGYRHPMGPLKLTDLVGLDVRLNIADYLHQELGGDQYKAPQVLRRMVRAGKLGRKSGEGFYKYE
ncbi:MAG TPA: 3-hydroxyacyl-CoA dehydrogenase family protein [bacterium]|nr:3-hydroxyacyl-CoA dehydrogenase family protein [bacterium]